MADPTFRAPITNPYSLDPFYSDVQLDFVDIDGDGDLDAFQGVFDGTVRFFRNIGSAASASFAAPTDSFGFGDVGGYARPAFGDLDGDGDLDAIVGKDSAGLSVFINTGSAANPAFTPAANFSGMPTDETGLDPVLVDIDGDGALDLFVGSTQGQTRFFRNSGTSQAAAFVEVTDSFSLGDVGLAASPAFADIDGDGDLDAFIGNSVGVTTFFRNTGAPFSPAFTQEMDNFGITTFAGRVQVALADIDADGDIDALIGSLSKLQLFLNDAAGVRLIQTAGGTAVGEGRLSDTYAVALNAAPSADVTITLSVRNGQVAPDRQTLLFTPANWDVPQPVHLVAVDDTIGEGRHAAVIGHAVVSGDAAYNGLEAPSLLVQVDDNDLPIGTQVFGPVALEPFGLASSLPGGTAAWLDIDADGDQDAVIGTATGEIRVFLAADQGPNGPNLQLSGNSFGLTNMSGQA
ncbi:MAG: VCBS repeat-containing protein, partial [Rhodoferax sp.]|nr:VCBS repeat-containing protein [Rhodoferax sp.]